MPEGPEIRIAADRVAAVLVGHTIDAVWFAFDRLQPFVDDISGTRMTAVDTHGKGMLTRFDNGLTLYSHNQLYGRWYTATRGKPPETRRSLRVALHTASHSALLYSASDVDVLTDEGLALHPFLSRLGPDVLDHRLTAAKIACRLADNRFRGRSLGSLYLDQGFLAGIGNYLRSEILFRAAAHPADRPADIDRNARMRLGRHTLAVSRRSYATKGITLSPGKAAKLKARGLPRGQYRFWVFGREGQPCHECGMAIRRTAISSRRLFLCPTCQPSRC